MKNFIFIVATLLVIIIFTACTTKPQTDSDTDTAPYDEGLIYKTRDDFYKEVNGAKDSYEKKGEKTFERLEEIT